VARLSPFKMTVDVDRRGGRLRCTRPCRGALDCVERSARHPAGELKSEKKSGLRVHGKTGLPCPVCGDAVREVSFANKSLQYCATCQTAAGRSPTAGSPGC
jgi:formamidopyrimidine-DNA glycosylase